MAAIAAHAVHRSLQLSVLDGLFYAVMVGLSESYFGALAVELGHRDTALALLVTLPLVAGALIQLVSGTVMGWVGGRKRLVVGAVVLQGFCHVGFYFIAQQAEPRLWPLLLTKTLFWLCGSIVVPPWNAWLAMLTEGVARERYFAWRSALVYLALLGAYLGGGVALEQGRSSGQVLARYGLLYLIALAARLLSAVALALQADEVEAPSRRNRSTVGRWVEAARTCRWTVALYLAGLWFGTQIAVPFFTPYMLRDLHLDYTTYAVLISVSILTKALTFPLFHQVAERIGMRSTLVVAGAGCCLAPLLWAFLTSVPQLVAVQVLGGAAWGGVEFASFQLLIQASSKDTRVEMFALSNAANGLALLLGALVGSLALARWSMSYADVFVMSSVARTVALGALVAAPFVLAARKPLPRVATRIASVRPPDGAVSRAVPQALGDPSGQLLLSDRAMSEPRQPCCR